MCNFDCYYLNYFQKGDWELASVSTQFEIFLILSWSQVFEIGPLIEVFAEFYNNVVVFWRFVICLTASWFDNVTTFASPSSKIGEKNFSKKSVAAGPKILDFKEGKRS